MPAQRKRIASDPQQNHFPFIERPERFRLIRKAELTLEGHSARTLHHVRRLLEIIEICPRDEGGVTVRVEVIAGKLGAGMSSVRKWRKLAEEMGVLKVERSEHRRGGEGPSTFYIQWRKLQQLQPRDDADDGKKPNTNRSSGSGSGGTHTSEPSPPRTARQASSGKGSPASGVPKNFSTETALYDIEGALYEVEGALYGIERRNSALHPSDPLIDPHVHADADQSLKSEARDALHMTEDDFAADRMRETFARFVRAGLAVDTGTEFFAWLTFLESVRRRKKAAEIGNPFGYIRTTMRLGPNVWKRKATPLDEDRARSTLRKIEASEAALTGDGS